MNKQLAEDLQRKLGISQEQIVREEYEMIILKQLFESEIGKSFVFKGGTALRLAYGSPRFSEDLDFSIIEDFSKAKIDNIFKAVEKQYKTVKLEEALQKTYTYFGLFRIKEDFLNQTFSIKFEASIRPADLEKDKDYNLVVLNSKVTSLTVLAQVMSLERIKQEKKTIQPPRIRDIFDLWFIAQKQGRTIPMDFGKIDRKVVRRDLFKFLPEKDKGLIEKWLKEK
ncbi:MAG: nucleotidyl transferase AbiEii/AbiGii toxin family protein [Actinomycetota bacterium]|nr:nucleotidyl transferase AbiEii/AbiGii toxin family protein [Actinomycetota bacterium]